MNNVVNNKPQTAIFSKIRGQPNHSEMQRQLRKVSVHDESRSLHCVYTQKSQPYNDWKQGKLYLLQKINAKLPSLCVPVFYWPACSLS